MNTERRQTIMITVLIVLLALGAWWNAQWMLRQHRLARRDAADLAECQYLAGEISRLADRQDVAANEDVGTLELGQRIESASHQAGLAGDWLQGVYPQSSRPMKDSPFLQKPTVLAMQKISLGQMVEFLCLLTDGPTMSVQDLRMRMPAGETEQNVWNVEATVVYLVQPSASRAGQRR